MKPDELHPTAAALHDDDGRSAYQPGKRHPWKRGGFYAAEGPLTKSGPAAKSRWQRYWAALTTEQRRQQWQRAAWNRRRRRACPDCGAPCSGTGTGRCRACGISTAKRRRDYETIQRHLTEPFRGGRSRQHETRVAALAADQLRLPL